MVLPHLQYCLMVWGCYRGCIWRHGHGTRAGRGGLALSLGNHRVVGYRVPTEWRSLLEEHRGVGLISGFKQSWRAGFMAGYGAFACGVAGCRACGGGDAGGGR